MLSRLKHLRPIKASHRKTYRAGALAFGEQRGPAPGTESPSYAAVGAHPSYGAADGQPGQRHHDTRVEGGTRCFLTTMAMTDAHVERRGNGAVATSVAEASALDHCPIRFCMFIAAICMIGSAKGTPACSQVANPNPRFPICFEKARLFLMDGPFRETPDQRRDK